MPKPIAILGAGIAGLTCAWQLHRLGHEVHLYESTHRLGGTIQTLHREGFILEQGPDAWVTEKPAAAQLARDLGLEDELLPSNDAGRITYILHQNQLLPMPEGLRLMVPTNLEALARSPLITPAALAAYRTEPTRAAELRAQAPTDDESIAQFTLRHFGPEVLETIAAPLLAGVFGGDIRTLSVRAIMPAFVAMEREHGSLILALQSKPRPPRTQTIFTTLRTGLQTLVDRMAAELPPESIHLQTPITALHRNPTTWTLKTALAAQLPEPETLILATPASVTAHLYPAAAPYLPTESTSAVLAAFAFQEHFPIPQGFGFLVPPGSSSHLLAATFTDQKFPHRAPANARLLRAFFGGPQAPAILNLPDEQIAAFALAEFQKILGPLPQPAFHTIARWPNSLPQYAVGHQDRITRLQTQLPPHLHLLGNAYTGVGLPDLIHQARTLAQTLHTA